MLQNLVAKLYGQTPTNILYHYTSLAGLMGILTSKALWASEIKYLNDAEELKYLGNITRTAILQRKGDDDATSEILRQFSEWTKHRLDSGHLLFVCSFTENGNLLSQWRGYCPHGKGVSLGFSPGRILTAASEQSFLVGKCIYDRATQDSVVSELISAVISLAVERGPTLQMAPSQSYNAVFEELELDLLRSAALLKNPAFREENEWRLVSPFHIRFIEAPIKYREGATMLIPYLDFSLLHVGGEQLELDHIFVGPTPDMGLSFTSLSQFVRRHARCPLMTASQLPFRG